jgi:4-aminobutyrate--pyruvate transaminase
MHVHCDPRALEETGPFVIERGEGVYVFDSHGKRYLDGISGMWCTSLGYSQPRLVEAARRQMSSLPYCPVFGSRTSDVAERLAEELVALAPPHLEKVLFMNSGSEANDTALKIARYYHFARGRPGKVRIITHERAYHGSTSATAAATALPHMHHGFALDLDPIIRAAAPDGFAEAYCFEGEAAFVQRLVRQLEERICREDPGTIAAMIVEPVMGAGGVVVPPAAYLEQLATVLRRHDILFIADEVITGFLRTGDMFGSESFGVKPDLMTLAKGLSSAYQPISAVLLSRPVYEAVAEESHRLGTFGHGVTYSAHPVAAAVALETLKIYQEPEMRAHIERLSQHLQAGLSRLWDEPIVGDVRGIGLLGGVELVKDRGLREKFDPRLGAAAGLVRRAQERGVLLRALTRDVVVFCPPFISSESEIDRLLTVFAEALQDTKPALGAAA